MTGEALFDLTTIRSDFSRPEQAVGEMKDRAKRAIDAAKFPHEAANHEDTQAHLERLLERSDDAQGSIARRILTTGSETYKRAFAKYVAGVNLNSSEKDALDRAASLTTTAGGFAVPYVLDPTVVLTSNGVVNPIRSISRVIPITVDEWRGVSSAGVTAAYAAEATETSDGAPTLAQPTISTEKAQVTIPYSIEIGQDWGSMASEFAAMIQDSKDVLEATAFLSGTGSDQPFGVQTGATTLVTAGGSAALAVADLYATIEALPPRFRPNAQWVANLFFYNKVRQFDTAGGASLWQPTLRDGLANVPSGNTGAQLLGKGANELSTMGAALTTATKLAIFGDFSNYVIAERVGLNIEVIPHLLGTANNLPTGQRAIYAYWRNGAKVLSAAPFRVLKTG